MLVIVELLIVTLCVIPFRYTSPPFKVACPLDKELLPLMLRVFELVPAK